MLLGYSCSSSLLLLTGTRLARLQRAGGKVADVGVDQSDSSRICILERERRGKYDIFVLLNEEVISSHLYL